MNKLVLAGMLLGISSSIFAAPVSPCMTGSLASFITQGACSVGDLQFSGFAALPVPALSTPLATSAITVSPNLIGGPGLLFNLNATTRSGVLESKVGFNVSPLMGANTLLRDSTLTQTGGVATGTGVVAGVETICVGAGFTATIPNCPAGTMASRNLATFATMVITQNADNLVFGPTTLAGIVGDFSADPGTSGSASVTSFSVNISEIAGPASVPEPATILLTGCALIGLGFGRRLYSRRASRQRQLA